MAPENSGFEGDLGRSGAPAQKEYSTRKCYFAPWKLVVTFALSHDDAAIALSMSLETLQSFTVEILILGCSVNAIKTIWSAIRDRHRSWRYAPPLATDGMCKKLLKALGSIRGAPGRLIFPDNPVHVQALIRRPS